MKEQKKKLEKIILTNQSSLEIREDRIENKSGDSRKKSVEHSGYKIKVETLDKNSVEHSALFRMCGLFPFYVRPSR